MKGSKLPAFIASHFGKILPVLHVNSKMPFVWKITTHNMTDCCFLWTPHPNPLCIISFQPTYEQGMQYFLTSNYFSPPKKKQKKLCVLQQPLCIMNGLCCRGSNEWRKLLFLCDLSYLWEGSFVQGLLQYILEVWSNLCSASFLEAKSLVLDVNNFRNCLFFPLFPFHRAVKLLSDIV